MHHRVHTSVALKEKCTNKTESQKLSTAQVLEWFLIVMSVDSNQTIITLVLVLVLV